MLFSLRVVRDNQMPFQLKLDAATQAEARKQAEQQGLKVLQIKVVNSAFARQKSQFPLMLFCQEFRVLLEAGLSMTDVLDTLIQKENSAMNKSSLQQLLSAIQAGQTLSQAMTAQTNIFPSLLIASVSTAETTGNLPEALARYNQYSENVDLLRKRIVSASIYPAIVVSFGLLVFLFLLAYVIPKFSKIYETQVRNISGSTQFILTLGHFSERYLLDVLLALAAIVVLILWAIKQPGVRAKFYEGLWKLPYLGEKVRLYHLTRFYRTFAMLLKSGVTVSAGLTMVGTMLGASLQDNLLKARRLINEGKTFSEAFDSSALTTPVAMRLFRVGEKTGTLERMMEHAASFHEEQMIRWVDQFTKIFEPTLMAIIGLLIGGLVLMMYLPIFDIASGLQ
jgi:general secretion pathway protein F